MTAHAVVWPLVVGYTLGSVPFAWMIVRWTAGIDLRETGSGNVGATNALRTTRWRTGLVVALLDIAKGSLAVGLVSMGGGDAAARALGGLAAITGHIFPLWLRFRGGKGVATSCGVFAVLAPAATALAAAVFFVTVAVSRIVSLASLLATVVLAGGVWFGTSPRPVAGAACGAAALVIWRHRANIVRLLQGQERRI